MTEAEALPSRRGYVVLPISGTMASSDSSCSDLSCFQRLLYTPDYTEG